MKSYRKELTFNIPSRRGFVNTTQQVEEAPIEITKLKNTRNHKPDFPVRL